MSHGGATPLVSYVIRSFPKLSETFVLRELLALREAGVALEIWSLVGSGEDGLESVPAAAPLLELVRRPPAGRSGLLRMGADLLAIALRRPQRAAAAIGFAMQWTLRERDPRQLAALPYAAHLARHARAPHLHAHFANTPATTAVLAAMISAPGRTASYTGHARDLLVATGPAFLAAKTRRTAFAVSHSHHTAAVIERALGQPAPPVVIVRNVVALPEPAPAWSERQAGLVICTARLVEKKGIDTLISAVAQVPDAKLLLIGDGPDEADLRALAERLGVTDRVDFAGRLPSAEVVRRVAGARVFALAAREASDGDTDGLPVAILEAMAAGTPVVSTPIAGIPEAVIDGETGVLVAPDDPAALAAALRRLLGDDETARRLGDAGRSHVGTEFAPSRNAKLLEQLFSRRGTSAPDRA